MLAVNYTELRGHMKNMHLMENQTNYKWLMESKKQLEDGFCQVKELIEVAADE